MGKYYTLVRRTESGNWEAVFGDFDRDCVECERLEYEGEKLKILRTGETQREIEDAIARL